MLGCVTSPEDTTIVEAFAGWKSSWSDQRRYAPKTLYDAKWLLAAVCCQPRKEAEEARVSDLGLGSLEKLRKQHGFGPKIQEVIEAFLVENGLKLGDGWPQPIDSQEEERE